ncbi:MAG: hypothetical protein ACLTZM_12765 [Ruminococcus sp.]
MQNVKLCIVRSSGFFELLERSNPEAQALADQMIKCAAYSIDAAVRELHFSGEKIPVYLSGSILTKAASSGYLSMLKKALSCICRGNWRCICARKDLWKGQCSC